MYTIGIIGKGFVGNAVAHGFSSGSGYNSNILIYDKNPSLGQNTLEEVVTSSEFIFFCSYSIKSRWQYKSQNS